MAFDGECGERNDNMVVVDGNDKDVDWIITQSLFCCPEKLYLK